MQKTFDCESPRVHANKYISIAYSTYIFVLLLKGLPSLNKDSFILYIHVGYTHNIADRKSEINHIIS